MSPHNVSNLVTDLVEMAQATQRLPQVEAENARLSSMVEDYAKTVQSREIAIIGYKEEIETLHSRIRSLEVERDDASFRVLEAEDTAHNVLGKARDLQIILEVMLTTLDPPKPEPVKEPEPVTLTEDQHVPDPINSQTGSLKDTLGVGDAVHSLEDTTSGQSESSPTVNTGETQVSAGQSPVEQKAVGSNSVEQESGVVEPTKGPYFGKRYRDVAGYVNLHDWITGGGAEEDYYSNRGW